jgi:cytochrome c oxidase subunit 5a
LLDYRYEKEFDQVQDVFELQRNLNNAFAYDLVPSTSVITAALKAARRVNDYPTAVRIFEGKSPTIPVTSKSR